jgi:hypothetical protein
MEVDERVLTGLSRQRQQVCSEGRPRRLAGERGDDLVGFAIEHLNDLGANQLLGREMEPAFAGLSLNCPPTYGRPRFSGRHVDLAGWRCAHLVRWQLRSSALVCAESGLLGALGSASPAPRGPVRAPLVVR